MKANNAPTPLQYFERKLQKLITEKKEFDQMREDAKYSMSFGKTCLKLDFD